MSAAPPPWTARLRRPLPWGACLLAVALLQTAVIGWMVWDRISILRSFQEITLTPRPIDPRDLFRGDYVILDYPMNRIPGDVTFEGQGPVWVTIARRPPQGDPPADAPLVWTPIAVATDPPATVEKGAVAIRATATRYRRLEYGLERYYVPEGRGLELEQQIRDRAIEIIVAVSDDGRAAIKGLRVEGEVVFEEPWF